MVISAGADARQFPPLKIVRFVVEVDGQSVFDTGAIEDDEITGTVTACFEVSGSHTATIKVWDDGLHATDPVTKSQVFDVECGAAVVQTPSTTTPAPTVAPTYTPTSGETPVVTETPTATPTVTPTDTRPPPAIIFHIAGITTSFQHFSGNSDAIYFVTIQDQNGSPVAGVSVDGQVSGPLGTFPVSGVSGANGIAELRHNTTSFGTYTLNVTSVLGPGMTYDGGASVSLSASVTLQ